MKKIPLEIAVLIEGHEHLRKAAEEELEFYRTYKFPGVPFAKWPDHVRRDVMRNVLAWRDAAHQLDALAGLKR